MVGGQDSQTRSEYLLRDEQMEITMMQSSRLLKNFDCSHSYSKYDGISNNETKAPKLDKIVFLLLGSRDRHEKHYLGRQPYKS